MERTAGVGALFGERTRLEQCLGQGGFSSVWRGVDVTSDEVVAVKILHRRHRADLGVVERFRQEAELLSKLHHPCIARAFTNGTQEATPFFTLEYVQGEDLQDRLRRHSSRGRPIPLAGAGWVCERIADALSYAHGHAVIHRDLKPANIMVNAKGQAPFVKVMDFGAAKALESTTFAPTTVGRVIGSVAYLTPEQLRRAPVDGRTDQFTLAVILYEMLTLRRAWGLDASGQPMPFHLAIGDHNSQLDIMRRILRAPRPRVSDVRPDAPDAVDAVLARAMALNPGDRYPTIEAFCEAFRFALLEASARPLGTKRPRDAEETGPTLELPFESTVDLRGAPADLVMPITETAEQDLDLTVEDQHAPGDFDDSLTPNDVERSG